VKSLNTVIVMITMLALGFPAPIALAQSGYQPEPKTPNRLIWVSGQLDRRAYKEATALGWSLYESFTIAAER
jgi:hypothetical protein